jgi:glycolate oxidase FAD binding subunit
VDLIVSTRRMDGVVTYEPADLTLTAGAGIELDELVRSTAEHGQWLPADPPGGGEGSLGATVATASGGFLRTRYGSLRDLTLGLTLVTGDGRVLRLGGRVVKNVAGFDLVRLAVGSWGTLGLVTEVTVLLQPRPPATVRLWQRAEGLEPLCASASAAADAPFLPASVEMRETGEDGGRRGVLTVTLHGPDASVRSEARTLREAAPALEEMPADVDGPEDTPDPDLVVRMRLPAGDPRALVEAARTLGRLDGARENVLAGAPVQHRIDPLAGLARVVVPEVRTDGAWPDRWATHLVDLRRTLVGRGGGLTVEVAPASIEEGAGAWRAPGRTEAELSRRLRSSFDPAGVLVPGRLAGRGARTPVAEAAG